jgi:glycogen synthase
MTRVLHVLDHSLPLHSGYTFRTRAIMKAQAAQGLEVRGITGYRHAAKGPASEEVDGLAFHRTPGTPSGPAGMREWREVSAHAQAIVRLARDWRPDVLHAHSPALSGMAGLKAAKALGVPLVYEIRAFWEDAAVGNGTGRAGSVRYRVTRELENHVIAGADAVMTICQGLRNDLIARGFPADGIGVMPNGVDLSLFGQPPPRDPELAHELKLDSGPVIGFIGSFYDYEGLDDLIAAMPALVCEQPAAAAAGRRRTNGGGAQGAGGGLARSVRHSLRRPRAA